MGRKIALLVFLVVFLATVGWSAEKTAIAILDFEAKGEATQKEADVLTERVRVELFKTDRYSVMERSRMEDILKEKGFEQLICNEVSCMVEAGHILGVEQMVAGSYQKMGTLNTITLRVVDMETGKIIAMPSADCKECSIEEVALQTTRSVVQNLLLPQSTPKTYRGTKPLSGKTRKYFAQIRLGITEPSDVHELGPIMGLQFGRELSRWVRIAASMDRFSESYTMNYSGSYSGVPYSSSGENKVTFFLGMVSLDIQIPLKDSRIRPYFGWGAFWTALRVSRTNFYVPSTNTTWHTLDDNYEGPGFQCDVGGEYWLSSRISLLSEVIFISSMPKADYQRAIDLGIEEFTISGWGFRIGSAYHF